MSLKEFMKFTPTKIPDVILIEPTVFSDSRGFFFESYSKEIFSRNGISVEFVQDNHSSSARGVLRGLHYQVRPKEQAKLVRVVSGAAFDVVVDIRRGSRTFGKFVAHQLTAENKKMVYVPVGFAHGFYVLKDSTEFLYKVSSPYSPEHERGILWNDPELGIPWPKLDVDYVISEKDKRHPALKNSGS